ncbi:hypothetical protein C8C95_1764 [Acidovorax sp. 99]|uniref:TfpX/TfpZ family type IV pilin accessory protein n=1 Tax=Acidovorax sp. 99 TaxID=2135634 RepID=UPI000D5DF448|nr:TfpX/TfpZ family type IV pilin accessory protein [Acidovorax sp. 99]PVY90916.1 hypothetical protein C8C95_1764 [Acidovorax sp. 99]
MQNLRERLRACGIHLGASLCVALLAAMLVFGLWYPFPYREVSGGRTLFLLVVCIDVIIGPMITLVIFNKTKRQKELVMDLAVVGALQLAALIYGLWTVFVARPVHLVFEYTRMSVVHAIDIEPDQLAKAPTALQVLPVRGPTLIALRPFRDATEQFDATMAAVGGVPLAARGDLWQPYSESRAKVLEASKPAADLRLRFADQSALIDAAVHKAGRPLSQLRSLPMVGRDNAWTVLLDSATAEPVGFLPLDSF